MKQLKSSPAVSAVRLSESGEERASDSVCKVSVRDDFFPVTDGKIAFEIYLSQCAKAFG